MSAITNTNPSITVWRNQWTTAAAKVSQLAGKAKDELSYYMSLCPGWDGYRGKIFQETTVWLAQILVDQAASFFIQEDAIPSEITPGPIGDGSVDIEIAYKTKRIIITLDSNLKEISKYREERGNPVEEISCAPLNTLNLVEELGWLAN